ncbi:MAG: hypothetical protein Kow00106_02210 [Anaerolineae bacterium]
MQIVTRWAEKIALGLLLAASLAGCYRSIGGKLEPTPVTNLGVQAPPGTPLPEVSPTTEVETPVLQTPSLTPFPTLAPSTPVPSPTQTAVIQPSPIAGQLPGQGGPLITDTPAALALVITNTPTPWPTATATSTSSHTPTPSPTATATATAVPPTRTPLPTLPPTVGPTKTFTPVPFITFPPTPTYTLYFPSPTPFEAVPLAERPQDAGVAVAAAPTQTPVIAPADVQQPQAVAQVPTVTPTIAEPAPQVAMQATLTGGQMTATQIVFKATADAAATLGIPLEITPPAGAGGQEVIYVTATPPIPGQQVIYVTATPALAGGVCGEHLVVPGETLYRLATLYGVTVNQFAQANNIVNPDLIRAGDTLIVPCPVAATPTPVVTPFVPDGQGGRQGVYIVQPGDNIYRISLQFGVSMAELMAINGISPAQMNFLTVGQELIIPASATLPTATPPAGAGGGPIYIVITNTPTPPGFAG